jgi:putative PIN family toxin of toxin-antitoxin system
MIAPPRVVCDCNVLLQALISSRGPARAALDAAKERRVVLFVSPVILDELRDVASRSHLVLKFALTEDKVADFLTALQQCSHELVAVPHVFNLDRDPDDAHYVDLAVAADATLIVSRDMDLLTLGDLTTPEGRDFAARFPGLEILTPPQLLSRLAPPAAI